MNRRSAGWVLLCALWLPAARGADAGAVAILPAPPATERSGREIYRRFHEGLADPTCEDAGNPRWTAHFATAPRRFAGEDDPTLALFGYVVDALRAASLPTEYALIPFVESGYRPDARSPGGTAGLWQMIAVTARNHDVRMGKGYDGRLSPVDSTTAAVRYLKTLHGMFAGDWRLAVMAYNTGENRVLDALRRSGQTPAHADPAHLPGMPAITRDYVRKVHALSCLLDRADDGDAWLQALDHPVPVLQAITVTGPMRSLDVWAQRNGRDPALLRRLNPVLAGGWIPVDGVQVLAPVAGGATEMVATAVSTPDLAGPPVGEAPFVAMRRLSTVAPTRAVTAASTPSPTTDARAATPAADAVAAAPGVTATPNTVSRSNAPAPTPLAVATPAVPAVTPATTHTVLRGESAWIIARRYGLKVEDLLTRNHLLPRSVLRPGTVLQIALAGE
jgi:membrane-bound lytic murein transglycosylase D